MNDEAREKLLKAADLMIDAHMLLMEAVDGMMAIERVEMEELFGMPEFKSGLGVTLGNWVFRLDTLER